MPRELKIGLLTSAMMSFAMSLALSGFFTFFQFGMTTAWLGAWAGGFAIGWPLAFVISVLIGGPIRLAYESAAALGRVKVWPSSLGACRTVKATANLEPASRRSQGPPCQKGSNRAPDAPRDHPLSSARRQFFRCRPLEQSRPFRSSR
jgi:Protein of unknown function (DUF2798)